MMARSSDLVYCLSFPYPYIEGDTHHFTSFRNQQRAATNDYDLGKLSKYESRFTTCLFLKSRLDSTGHDD